MVSIGPLLPGLFVAAPAKLTLHPARVERLSLRATARALWPAGRANRQEGAA